MTHKKLMVSFREPIIGRLYAEAAELGVTVQEYLRAVIVPFYFKFESFYTEEVHKQIVKELTVNPLDFRKNREGVLRP